MTASTAIRSLWPAGDPSPERTAPRSEDYGQHGGPGPVGSV